jgi:hypothetical protein
MTWQKETFQECGQCYKELVPMKDPSFLQSIWDSLYNTNVSDWFDPPEEGEWGYEIGQNLTAVGFGAESLLSGAGRGLMGILLPVAAMSIITKVF